MWDTCVGEFPLCAFERGLIGNANQYDIGNAVKRILRGRNRKCSVIRLDYLMLDGNVLTDEDENVAVGRSGWRSNLGHETRINPH